MSEDIKAKALDIQSLLDYQKDSVVSREVIKKELGTVRNDKGIQCRFGFGRC